MRPASRPAGAGRQVATCRDHVDPHHHMQYRARMIGPGRKRMTAAAAQRGPGPRSQPQRAVARLGSPPVARAADAIGVGGTGTATVRIKNDSLARSTPLLGAPRRWTLFRCPKSQDWRLATVLCTYMEYNSTTAILLRTVQPTKSLKLSFLKHKYKD